MNCGMHHRRGLSDNQALRLSRLVALGIWLLMVFSVGRAAPGADDVAPFGLEDLFAMRMRPNPVRKTNGFDRIAAGISARWPELVVERG